MAEGERRIREITDPRSSPDREHLTDTRLGTFDVLQVIHLSAGATLHEYSVRLAIGLDRDGALMVTPNFHPATHLECERWKATPLAIVVCIRCASGRPIGDGAASRLGQEFDVVVRSLRSPRRYG